MATHHKATALRMIDKAQGEGPYNYSAEAAIIHAELETAAQIERIADGLNDLKTVLTEIGNFVTVSGILGPTVFNPERN